MHPSAHGGEAAGGTSTVRVAATEAGTAGANAGGAPQHEVEPERVCEPETTFCQGAKVVRCDLSGSASKLAENCDKQGKVCRDGACEPCSTGDCRDGYACDPTDRLCRKIFCEPGHLACYTGWSQRCNEYGTGYGEPIEDCIAKGERCTANGCEPKVCEPHAVFCLGSKVKQCDETGGTFWEIGYCNRGWHCAMDAEIPDLAYCSQVYCAAGEKACDGNMLQTCNQDGTDYLQGGTDCDGHAVCDEAECKPKLCNGVIDCVGGNVVNCVDRGFGYVVLKTCKASQQCMKGEDGIATCKPKP